MKLAQLKCHLKLIFCFCIMNVGQLIIGCSFSFSSTLLAQLREPSSKIKLDRDEESWITSITILICPIGLIIIGILMDRYGRKFATQIAFVPIAISWLIITFAESYYTILIGKIIFGIPFGVSSCMFLYICEICPAKLRPVYISMVSVSVGIGMMFECILSMYFCWQTISAILCTISTINFLMLFMVPESPMWLKANGRAEEADKVIKWFGLEHISPKTISNIIIESPIKTEICNDDGHETSIIDKKSYFSLFLHPTVWKPAVITLTFFALQQGSGLYVLLFYSMDVLRDCKVRWDGNTVSLYMSAARVLGGICFGLLHSLKRRTLLIISGGCMAISLLVIVTYIKIFQNVEDPPLEMTLIIAFIMFMFFSLLGILPLPWILCGEVFPMAVKGVMNGIVLMCGYLLWFAICKIYPSLIIQFGVEIVWSIFAAFCILNVLFAIFIMPETKGKSLDEILMYFESRKEDKKKENFIRY